MIPPVKGTCPTFQTGANTLTVNGFAMNVTAWVGARPAAGAPRGSLIIYWHGTVETGQTATYGLGQPAIDEVVRLGGMVAAPENTSMTGQNTGNGVWYTGDFDFADQIVACAVQQLDIDTRHIHTGGYSAGGLQTVYMWYQRSGYLASAVSYSGGMNSPVAPAMQDPSNKAPVIVAHGAMGSDVLILDFAQASAQWETLIKQAGGFYVDCNDGGAHFNNYMRLTDLAPGVWEFFKAHPFKGTPISTLPAVFPKYCALNGPGTPPP
jgi:poly(3-hydroxybutyrate) depolymerase